MIYLSGSRLRVSLIKLFQVQTDLPFKLPTSTALGPAGPSRGPMMWKHVFQIPIRSRAADSEPFKIDSS